MDRYFLFEGTDDTVLYYKIIEDKKLLIATAISNTNGQLDTGYSQYPYDEFLQRIELVPHLYEEITAEQYYFAVLNSPLKI